MMILEKNCSLLPSEYIWIKERPHQKLAAEALTSKEMQN